MGSDVQTFPTDQPANLLHLSLFPSLSLYLSHTYTLSSVQSRTAYGCVCSVLPSTRSAPCTRAIAASYDRPICCLYLITNIAAFSFYIIPRWNNRGEYSVIATSIINEIMELYYARVASIFDLCFKRTVRRREGNLSGKSFYLVAQ